MKRQSVAEATPPTRAARRSAARAQAQPQQAVAPKAQSRAVAVHRPEPQEHILHVISRAAADPKCQPEKMRALLDMQKEIMAEEARRAFTKDFIAMQAALPIINATGRIEIEAKRADRKKQNTPFATFNEINKVTKPILRAHGFALWFAPDERGPGLMGVIVRGYLDHVGGHSKTCVVPVPLENSGSKNDAQGQGSAISYGKRYCAIALLNLISEAPEDRDDDAQATSIGATIDEEQRTAIMEKAATVGCSPANLLKGLNDVQPKGKRYPRIETLEQLVAERYQEAMDRLDRFAAAVAAREGANQPRGAQ